MDAVAVVILNYNGAHFLEQFLPSVVQHSAGHRLIVADNASTDNSLAFLAERYPQIEVMAFDQNHGFAEGYNRAMAPINNQYSVLLNSDAGVTAGWIDPVLALMESDEQIVACQPKILAYHQQTHFEHAGAAGGYVDTLGYPFCRGRIIDHTEEDTGQYDQTVPVFWASGACFFVRTHQFRAFGGFDPLFHAHMEEIDFCWRVQAAGLKIYCEPRSVVYHVGGGTMPATNPRKTYLNFRNSTGMLYKNTPDGLLWWKIPLKLLLDVVAMLRFYGKGEPQNGQAIGKAIVDFVTKLSTWRASRARVTQRISSKPAVMMPRLLVVERYVKGRKTFSVLNFSRN